MKASPVTVCALSAALVCSSLPASASAQARPSSAQRQQQSMTRDIPRCTRSLGTISIADGDNAGARQFNLAGPQKLLKSLVQRSGCFRLVDRGAGMTAAKAERELSSGGDLRRGANVGKGQITAADYVLVAEVSGADSNTGGGAVGLGALGSVAGMMGGRLGRLGSVAGALGGVKSTKLEANTVLSLTDVRSSETVAVTEGYATRNNVSFGGGAGFGFGGAIGGGYEDTEIGKIVTQSFINAYANLVSELGGLQTQQAAQRAFKVVKPVALRRSPAASSSVVRDLDPGLLVYPTGAKEGMWWEVADENDNTGWVLNENLAPAERGGS